ncbi:hypothetical protein TSUD_218480 [Trifolium subterraneum]|uniref:Uncharacterized protein n=1 Tax=Trifolium subterraneum TaxID=3900 RepID=A0A2Z6MMH4_TRISU|nr:hypothetical protein TSUD_218480 [Trifolium subterraneum]
MEVSAAPKMTLRIGKVHKWLEKGHQPNMRESTLDLVCIRTEEQDVRMQTFLESKEPADGDVDSGLPNLLMDDCIKMCHLQTKRKTCVKRKLMFDDNGEDVMNKSKISNASDCADI